MQNNKERILWITRTAVFIAILITLQAVTRPLGQYVTGSLVNLVLILAVMLGGMASGATVALLSPFFAFMFGIGPAMIQIIPFQALGNLSLVLVWHFIAGKAEADKLLVHSGLAAIAGAVVKFCVLYLGIVKLAIPVILQLPEPKAAAMSAIFSVPQLITAGIGGLVAVAVLPLLRKAVVPTPAH